jgi:beta-mannosidase
LFVVELWQRDRRAAMQAAAFVPTKHLSLTDPGVTANVQAGQDGLVVDLAARSPARLVELSLDGADAVFSDNNFDLPAGRKASISCPMPVDWTPAQARAALKIRSIYDSYAHAH